MNPTLEQLARYIVQELDRGVPEITLYNALRESGWTQEWISAGLSTAKQRAMPVSEGMTIPPVQQIASPIKPQQQTRIVTDKPAKVAPVQKKLNPIVKPVLPKVRKTRLVLPLKKYLLILIAILSLILLGLSIFRGLQAADRAASLRISRDADRREDLSTLLSNLSDYYVAHGSYPTRTQLNTSAFIDKNNFSVDSMTDPKWTPKDEICVKDGKPQLAGIVTTNCYAYEVSGANKGICNNGSIPCTTVKVTISLEATKNTYQVIFDKNKQIDS